VARGLFDEDARRLMSRARVVSTFHVHAYPSFENRCVQALFCGRPLASEPLSNRFLEPGVDFLVGSTPEELVDAVAEIPETGRRRPVSTARASAPRPCGTCSRREDPLRGPASPFRPSPPAAPRSRSTSSPARWSPAATTARR
jgi:hypothetical protein